MFLLGLVKHVVEQVGYVVKEGGVFFALVVNSVGGGALVCFSAIPSHII
jgi:hypothetical protein